MYVRMYVHTMDEIEDLHPQQQFVYCIVAYVHKLVLNCKYVRTYVQMFNYTYRSFIILFKCQTHQPLY